MRLVVQLKPVHWTLTRELLTSWYCAMQKVASTKSEHLNAHHSLARPYRRGFHRSPELSWVLTMRLLQYRWTEVWYALVIAPLPQVISLHGKVKPCLFQMPISYLPVYSFPVCLSVLHITYTQVFVEAGFLELDVTCHAASEMEHLINAVTFNYTTMHCKFNKTMVMFIIRSGHVYLYSALDYNLIPKPPSTYWPAWQNSHKVYLSMKSQGGSSFLKTSGWDQSVSLMFLSYCMINPWLLKVTSKPSSSWLPSSIGTLYVNSVKQVSKHLIQNPVKHDNFLQLLGMSSSPARRRG